MLRQKKEGWVGIQGQTSCLQIKFFVCSDPYILLQVTFTHEIFATAL